MGVLARFDPQWPNLIFAVAQFENENVGTANQCFPASLSQMAGTIGRFPRDLIGLENRVEKCSAQ